MYVQKVAMKRNRSYANFKNDLEEVFSAVVCLQYYSHVTTALDVNKKATKIDNSEDGQIFQSIYSFESHYYLYNYLFIALIAMLESYLQDRLIGELEKNEEKINQVLAEYPANRKWTGEDVIKGPKQLVSEIVSGTVFHNLPAVNSLYKIVYGVDILALMKEKDIFTLIKVRHRIVHHSGRIAGKRILIRESGILKAMNLISRWIERIEFFLSKKRERKTFPNYFNRFFRVIKDFEKTQIYRQSVDEMIRRSLVNMDVAIKTKDFEKYLRFF